MPAPKENWETIDRTLQLLLEDVKQECQSVGLTPLESCPVAHSTDNYAKHRFGLCRRYRTSFQHLTLSSVAPTPKGPAFRKRVFRKGRQRRRLFWGGRTFQELPLEESPTIITDDCLHDQIRFRAACPTYAPDATNAKFDHHDMLIRLSESEMPPVQLSGPEVALPLLSMQSQALLQQAVSATANEFDRQLPNASAAAIHDIKVFVVPSASAESA